MIFKWLLPTVLLFIPQAAIASDGLGFVLLVGLKIVALIAFILCIPLSIWTTKKRLNRGESTHFIFECIINFIAIFVLLSLIFLILFWFL